MSIGLISLIANVPVPAAPLGRPFYDDWTFWQGFVALLALVLSQCPPLIKLFRPGRLKLDLPTRLLVTHTYGNANVVLLVGLRNVGSREIQVRSLSISVKRDKSDAFRLDARQFENPGDSRQYLLVPFTISPGENWVRFYHFYEDFDRQTDKQVRERKLAVAKQIRERRAKLPPNSSEIVNVDDVLWEPFKMLFDRLFKWAPGEYEIELKIETDPRSANFSKQFRFTLFESDSEQLRDHVQEYKTGGGGIFWRGERLLGVSPSIVEPLR
ncbi:hypothetical protein [Dyella acidiphila]|uniref:SMODS-associated and fused to various effectors domain-containing protein n=1 Tax=Dyella acidiphila TaxID=2775866 RepID=A0ABR9GDM6_9GAMM|nr:hypothetical protein [Dyella acidiphila]MBE1162126.1 hypothetical protein [Dyella acidiphila]